MNSLRLLPSVTGTLAFALAACSTFAQETRVVAAWDTFDNNPNYVAGTQLFDQTSAATGQRFGFPFDVLATKGDTVKQATRQSTDGTFGDATGLLTWEGNPISATSENSALRINLNQSFTIQFTNTYGAPIQLGDLLFDWSRSATQSPDLRVSFVNSASQSTTLLEVLDTPVASLIGDYPDFRIDLRSTVIQPGDHFSLVFLGFGGGGGTGGNLDNLALTAVIPEPAVMAALLGGGVLAFALRRRRLASKS